MKAYLLYEHEYPKSYGVRGIMLEAEKPDGTPITISWDHAEHTFTDGQTASSCEGICINNQYADSHLTDLEGLSHISFVGAVDVDVEVTDASVKLLSLIFEENGKQVV